MLRKKIQQNKETQQKSPRPFALLPMGVQSGSQEELPLRADGGPTSPTGDLDKPSRKLKTRREISAMALRDQRELFIKLVGDLSRAFCLASQSLNDLFRF